MPQAQKIGKHYRVPAGYEIWKSGIYVVDYDKIPRDKDGTPRIELDDPDHTVPIPSERKVIVKSRLAPAPMWIQGQGQDLDTGEHYMLIRTNQKGQRHWIPMRALNDSRFLSDLAAHRYPVDSVNAKPLTRFLNAMIQCNGSRPIVLMGKRTGHYELPDRRSGWLLGETWIGPAGSRIYPIPDEGSALTRAIKERGLIDAWVEAYRTRVEKNQIARWLTAISFAAPLLRPLEVRTFCVHHWSDSGYGKTAAANFAQSAFGRPKEFTATFNATRLAILEQLTYLSDLPLAFDELQAASYRDDLRDVIYQLVSETPRQRSKTTGGLEKSSATWRTIIRFTGEQPLLADEALDLGGIRNRILEVNREAFTTSEARAMHMWMESPQGAYGAVGRRYLESIVPLANEMRPIVKMRHRAHLEALETELGRSDQRLDNLAAIAVGQETFYRHILEETETDSCDRAREDALAALEFTGISSEAKTPKYKDRILKNIEAAIPSLRVADLRTDEGQRQLEEFGLKSFEALIEPGAVYRSGEGDLWWFTTQGFRRVLQIAGLQKARTVRELKRMGRLECNTGRSDCKKRTHPTRKIYDRFYVIKRKQKPEAITKNTSSGNGDSQIETPKAE